MRPLAPCERRCRWGIPCRSSLGTRVHECRRDQAPRAGRVSPRQRGAVVDLVPDYDAPLLSEGAASRPRRASVPAHRESRRIPRGGSRRWSRVGAVGVTCIQSLVNSAFDASWVARMAGSRSHENQERVHFAESGQSMSLRECRTFTLINPGIVGAREERHGGMVI
jgi:hypothetical protein